MARLAAHGYMELAKCSTQQVRRGIPEDSKASMSYFFFFSIHSQPVIMYGIKWIACLCDFSKTITRSLLLVYKSSTSRPGRVEL